MIDRVSFSLVLLTVFAAHAGAKPLEPGTLDFDVIEGSRVTTDCRLSKGQRDAIAFQKGRIVVCIAFAPAKDEPEGHWETLYRRQVEASGWTFRSDMGDVYYFTRPTAQAGCTETLDMYLGLQGFEEERLKAYPGDDPPQVTTLAMVHDAKPVCRK